MPKRPRGKRSGRHVKDNIGLRDGSLRMEVIRDLTTKELTAVYRKAAAPFMAKRHPIFGAPSTGFWPPLDKPLGWTGTDVEDNDSEENPDSDSGNDSDFNRRRAEVRAEWHRRYRELGGDPTEWKQEEIPIQEEEIPNQEEFTIDFDCSDDDDDRFPRP